MSEIKTAKEKAEELVKKISPFLPWYTKKDNLSKSKQIAIILINEQIGFNGNYYLENKESKIDYSYYCKVNGELFDIKNELELL
jgi:hypothetical protein